MSLAEFKEVPPAGPAGGGASVSDRVHFQTSRPLSSPFYDGDKSGARRQKKIARKGTLRGESLGAFLLASRNASIKTGNQKRAQLFLKKTVEPRSEINAPENSLKYLSRKMSFAKEKTKRDEVARSLVRRALRAVVPGWTLSLLILVARRTDF